MDARTLGLRHEMLQHVFDVYLDIGTLARVV
jgi:hypothetical protein